jgi:hypothetical protein
MTSDPRGRRSGSHCRLGLLSSASTATALSECRSSLVVVAKDLTPDPITARYLDLVDDLMGIDGVTPPPGGSGFGRGSLKYRGKIFAMLVRGSLVLKLPADRVTALIKAGDGAAFDANKGTAMREWFSLAAESELEWLALATEALEFARTASAR